MNSALWKSLMAVLTMLALATVAPAADTGKTNSPGKEEEPEPNFLITPQVRMIQVDGDKHKFREDYWMQDGWTGGIEEFSWHQMFGAKKDTLLEIEARGLYDDDDYMMKLQLVKPDFGFVRTGFTQYRKYFDDTGGYYVPFRQPYFDLQQDVSLLMGNWYVDLGLTIPHWPKITFGFEHQSKEGDKSMLEWGTVAQTISVPATSVTKNIYPNVKSIYESVDIFKADVEYDIGKVHMADQFRFESYDNDTTRADDTGINLTTGVFKPARIREDFSHQQFSNAYFVESHIHDKVYVSAGYLYVDMTGDADFNMATFYGVGTPVAGTDKFWLIRDAKLNQDSHVLNASVMFGPFWGTTLYAGAQVEETYTDAFSNSDHREGVGPSSVVLADTSTDKGRVQENAGIRFTKIPYTVIYGEGRWVRESIDVYRSVIEGDGAAELEQRTDGDIERDEYVAGFNTSPIRRASLTGQYRNSYRRNRYDHEIDFESGYPAFITDQEFQTHEISAKLTVRPHNRVTASLKFQMVDTDIDTDTQTLSAAVPGGNVNAANYRAKIYSANVTFTPINRLYLSGYFSLTDSQTVAFDNYLNAVQPSKNDSYTAMGSAGYAIDDKTEATVEYMYQRVFTFDNNGWSSNGRPLSFTPGTVNVDAGMPLGTDSTRRMFSAGISRRITKNITARLRYGYFQYDEPSGGNVNDYLAHMAMASCAIRF
ncbi:MAG: hypothetical protein HZA91_07895 [Verrucomicrobia bacterium]|nr:hypothetical protein [Verrucomicrobiota bacterium]